MGKLTAAALTFAAGVALAFAIPATPEPVQRFQIEVTTHDGNLYIAGVGDDCRAAWEGAAIPAGWQDIICVAAN